jgi:GMC oxidoreductase
MAGGPASRLARAAVKPQPAEFTDASEHDLDSESRLSQSARRFSEKISSTHGDPHRGALGAVAQEPRLARLEGPERGRGDGTDPRTSALNRYCQTWYVSNVFVTGACAFPQNAGTNPTRPVGALAYWTVDCHQALPEQSGTAGAGIEAQSRSGRLYAL